MTNNSPTTPKTNSESSGLQQETSKKIDEIATGTYEQGIRDLSENVTFPNEENSPYVGWSYVIPPGVFCTQTGGESVAAAHANGMILMRYYDWYEKLSAMGLDQHAIKAILQVALDNDVDPITLGEVLSNRKEIYAGPRPSTAETLSAELSKFTKGWKCTHPEPYVKHSKKTGVGQAVRPKKEKFSHKIEERFRLERLKKRKSK